MDIIVDFFVEMLFDVYGELMFLVVPEFKGSRNCEIVAVIIAILVLTTAAVLFRFRQRQLFLWRRLQPELFSA